MPRQQALQRIYAELDRMDETELYILAGSIRAFPPGLRVHEWAARYIDEDYHCHYGRKDRRYTPVGTLIMNLTEIEDDEELWYVSATFNNSIHRLRTRYNAEQRIIQFPGGR